MTNNATPSLGKLRFVLAAILLVICGCGGPASDFDFAKRESDFQAKIRELLSLEDFQFDLESELRRNSSLTPDQCNALVNESPLVEEMYEASVKTAARSLSDRVALEELNPENVRKFMQMSNEEWLFVTIPIAVKQWARENEAEQQQRYKETGIRNQKGTASP